MFEKHTGGLKKILKIELEKESFILINKVMGKKRHLKHYELLKDLNYLEHRSEMYNKRYMYKITFTSNTWFVTRTYNRLIYGENVLSHQMRDMKSNWFATKEELIDYLEREIRELEYDLKKQEAEEDRRKKDNLLDTDKLRMSRIQEDLWRFDFDKMTIHEDVDRNKQLLVSLYSFRRTLINFLEKVEEKINKIETKHNMNEDEKLKKWKQSNESFYRMDRRK